MDAVCVDASLVLHLVLPGPLTPKVEALVAEWVREGRRMVAPRLWVWEIANVLWRWTRRSAGAVPVEAARKGLEQLLQLPVTIVDVEDKALDAWDEFLSGEGLPSAYDACYLMVARVCGCKVWTCDQRMAELAHNTGMVELVG